MAAPIVSIEEVTLTFASGDASKAQDLTKGQTQSKCVPMMTSYEVDATGAFGADDTAFGIEIYDNAGTPAVRATRTNSGSGITGDITIYVWEFTSDVNVYSGSWSGETADSRTMSIGATVDTTKAFVVCTSYSNVTTILSDDASYATSFASSTQIKIERAATGTGTYSGFWYVVEDNTAKTLFDVRHATLTLTTTQPQTATVGSFTLSKSIVLANGFSALASSDQRIDSAAVWLSGTTTVNGQRNSTSSTALTIYTQTIDFKDDNVVVDRGSNTLTTGTATTNHSLSQTYSENSAAHVTNNFGFLACVNTAHTTTATFYLLGKVRGVLDSTRDGIDISRKSGGTQSVTYNWEAIDFGSFGRRTNIS